MENTSNPVTSKSAEVGDVVEVVWNTKEYGVTQYKEPNWVGKRILEIRTFGDGFQYAILEHHPFCPVRLTRCLPK